MLAPINKAKRKKGFFRSLFRHIQVQLIVFGGLAMSASIILFSLYQIDTQSDATLEAIQTQALTLTENLSIASGDYLISGDYSSLEQLLLQSAAFPEVLEIWVMDQQGKVFSHVRKKPGEAPQALFEGIEFDIPDKVQTITKRIENKLEVISPIELGKLGWVKTQYSLQQLDKIQQGIIEDAILADIFAVLISLSLLVLVLRRPIYDLEKATRFARSLFESRGDVMSVAKGSIELEQLGHALNFASISLHSATREMADIKFALDAHAIVAMTDSVGHISYVNENFCSISGYTSDELIGNTYRLLNSGHHEDEFFKLLWETITNGDVWHGEILNKNAHGEKYWIESTIVPFLSDSGEPYQYVSIETDITERKQAEELTARLGRMLDNSSNEIYVFSKNNLKLIQINSGALINQGINPGRLTETSFLDIQKDISASDFEEIILPLLEDIESSVVYETLHYRTNGTHYPVDVRLQYYPNETPALFVAIVQDISERKKSELLQREYNQQLEQEVQERTKELQVANSELESFCYSVSHDLRAPLRSIDGFSNALLEDFGKELPDEAKDYLSRVRSSSDRMGELINDLLDLSRVVRTEMYRADVDISAIASSILDELKADYPDRVVDVKVMPELIVQGDGRLLRTMLENILGNAWKFTARKENAQIEFGVQEIDDKQVFYVRDNGAGFDETYAHKLFEPFQRLHTNDEFDGTGIGLATVRRIIRRHAGDVWATGETAKGATVYFTLG